jgi:hypothetical protein
LRTAIEEENIQSKTTPLTVWKNNWLAKNADNNFIFSGELENRRIEALAQVLDEYQRSLAENGLYDLKITTICVLRCRKGIYTFCLMNFKTPMPLS